VIKLAAVVSATCGTSTCSYTPTLNLTNGSYKWRVRAGNAFGWGAYSTWLNFSTSAPLAPTPQSPSGANITGNPIFTWTRPPGGTRFALYVYTTANVQKFAAVITPTTCSTSTCSYAPTLNLTAGSYKWAVRAGNTFGWGAYSTWLNFSTSAPLAPTPQSPTGTITTGNPTFTWTKPAGATQYALYIYTTANVQKFAAVITPTCGTSTCSYTPTLNLTAGSYKWRARAGNTFGWSAYSAWLPFNR
jgi:predicted phage tail protein